MGITCKKEKKEGKTIHLMDSIIVWVVWVKISDDWPPYKDVNVLI